MKQNISGRGPTERGQDDGGNGRCTQTMLMEWKRGEGEKRVMPRHAEVAGDSPRL